MNPDATRKLCTAPRAGFWSCWVKTHTTDGGSGHRTLALGAGWAAHTFTFSVGRRPAPFRTVHRRCGATPTLSPPAGCTTRHSIALTRLQCVRFGRTIVTDEPFFA